VSGKFLSNHPKTVCQILTDSFLTVAFCQTARRGVSANFQLLPLLKNIESSGYGNASHDEDWLKMMRESSISVLQTESLMRMDAHAKLTSCLIDFDMGKPE